MTATKRMRPRVLLLEDDEVAALLRAALEAAGYVVATTSTAAGALQMLASHQAALILVDLDMRGADARSFFERWRERKGSAHLLAFGRHASGGHTTADVDASAMGPFALAALLDAVDLTLSVVAPRLPRSRGPVRL